MNPTSRDIKVYFSSAQCQISVLFTLYSSLTLYIICMCMCMSMCRLFQLYRTFTYKCTHACNMQCPQPNIPILDLLHNTHLFYNTHEHVHFQNRFSRPSEKQRKISCVFLFQCSARETSKKKFADVFTGRNGETEEIKTRHG